MSPRKSFVAIAALFLTCFPLSRLKAQINTTRHTIDNQLDGGYWIHAVDFDGDGDSDLVAASLRSALKWYENDKRVKFTRQNISDSFTDAWSIHANDIDGDGDIDVLACSTEPDETAWFERESDGSFKKQVIDKASADPHSVFSGDIDADGDVDVLVAAWQSKRVALWDNDGSQRFSEIVLDNNFSSAHSVYAADLDNDGDLDPIAGGGGKTAWWQNSGAAAFKKATFGNRGAFSVFASDVDGDGKLDVLRNQRNNGDLDWFRNNGRSFEERTVSPGLGETWSIAAGDLDLDGDQDIVAAAYVPNKLVLWTNDGNNRFTESVLDQDLVRPRCVELADFDQDGDLDIAAVTRSDQVFLYEVLGSPQPTASVTLTEPNGGEILEAGSNYSIRWQSSGAVGEVNLEFSSDGGNAWRTINANAPNTGTYNWTLPDLESSSVLVKVSANTNQTILDTSDGAFSIVISSLAVISPNGGEKWFAGSTRNISWNAIGLVNSIKIEYSQDAGSNWYTIANSAEATASYAWKIPNLRSDDMLIRISDASDGDPVDLSDAGFSVAPSTLSLLAPAGGETWFSGGRQTILWTSTGAIDSVEVEYSLNDGRDWVTIANSAPNSGRLHWSIPSVASDSARVRISDATTGAVSSVSTGRFSVVRSTLTLTLPNGGESWAANSSERISWVTTGNIDSVTLAFSPDSGSSWQTIVASLPNTSVYDWKVPDQATTVALVRVSHANWGSTLDVSDQPFKIAGSSLSIVAPNGGETWPANGNQTIKWSSSGSVSAVRIELSEDAGTTWSTVVSNTANSGSYDWKLPNVQSEACLIRISDAEDGSPFSVSSAFFIIGITTDVTFQRDSEAIPKTFNLSQNYPNPFNPATTIRFSVPNSTEVHLGVYNLIGELVTTLVAQRLAAGDYRIEWDAEYLPSGAYLYQLRAQEFRKTLRLTLLK